MSEERSTSVQDNENKQQILTKRKVIGSDTEPPVSSKKKRKICGTPQTKNPVQSLNEYEPGMTVRTLGCIVCNEQIFSGLWYEVLSQTGPPHDPLFRIGIKLWGMEFTGEGR